MSRWFPKHDVADYGSAILADEDAVLQRTYRPVTRFAYFLFKPTYQHLQGDLRKHLGNDLESLLQGRTLVVSARNEKSTLEIEPLQAESSRGPKNTKGRQWWQREEESRGPSPESIHGRHPLVRGVCCS